MKFGDFFVKKPRGRLVYEVTRRGMVIERHDEENLIVGNSRLVHARLLGGDVAGRSVAQFGVGTNGVAPADGNNALTVPFLKALDSVTYPNPNQVAFAFSLTTGEANGKAILEFGLLTAGGMLYARKIRNQALNKDADIALAGTWTITYPA